MKYRRFGRTGWNVSEIGYGMWGLAGWTGSDMNEIESALQRSADLGCNFYDTAWAYGEGRSEQVLARLLKNNQDKKLYAASKIPPKNRQWPSKPDYSINEVFPADYIIEYTEKTLKNLGLEKIDLQQFHVWNDNWSDQDEWKQAIEKLRQQGKADHWGISVNRWEPANVINTLRTGLISSVQVIYNIFDQNPEDELFPVCKELDVAVIARVPFDEGSLTGLLTHDTVFPKDDWRSTYFVPENLYQSVDRADRLKPLIPEGMTMAEMALRFILDNPQVGTIIPGMRKLKHVESNISASDGKKLNASLIEELRKHRWERKPASWSQ